MATEAGPVAWQSGRAEQAVDLEGLEPLEDLGEFEEFELGRTEDLDQPEKLEQPADPVHGQPGELDVSRALELEGPEPPGEYDEGDEGGEFRALGLEQPDRAAEVGQVGDLDQGAAGEPSIQAAAGSAASWVFRGLDQGDG